MTNTSERSDFSSFFSSDLNSDGVINAADLSLAKRAALTGAAYQYQQAADLNGNLELDKEGLSLFADYLTGKNVSFADAKYAASEQKYEQGVHEALNTGFTYKDYINLDNNRQSNLIFSVNVRQKGNNLCTFKIANGSANDRSMMISVNGGSEQWKQSFLSTGT